jgi:hypothetical protein
MPGCAADDHRTRQATALHALTQGGVPACTHCRPDTALGVLE